jgi:hypothetical protein
MPTLEPSLADLKRITDLAKDSNKALALERECTLVQVLAARRSIKIKEHGEPLQPIPNDLFSLEDSHLYVEV